MSRNAGSNDTEGVAGFTTQVTLNPSTTVEALTSNALSSAPERRAAEVVATVTFIASEKKNLEGKESPWLRRERLRGRQTRKREKKRVDGGDRPTRTRGRKERGQSFEPPADRGGYRARVSSPTRRCAGDRRTRITSAPTRPSGSRVLVGRLGCRESARSDARARVPSETRALEARRQNAAGRGIATRRSDYVDAPRRDEESASACLLRVSCVCAR